MEGLEYEARICSQEARNPRQPGFAAMTSSSGAPSSWAPTRAPPISAKDFKVSRTAFFSSAILASQSRSDER